MKRAFVLSLALLASAFVYGQRTLTLDECRSLAIQNNKELQIAGEKVRVAGYDKQAALTKYFPQVSAMGTYMRNQKDINLLDDKTVAGLGKLLPIDVGAFTHLDIQDVWLGNVSLVQPVFMGGKIIAYNQITKYAKELAQSMNDLKLQDVIYKTDEAYWQVVSLVNKKKLADSYVSLLRKMDTDVQALIEEGVATQVDGMSVRVKLNQAEMAQTKVDNGLALSRMALAQLCGLPLEESLALADENIESLPESTSSSGSFSVEEAFINRQELKSLDYAVRIYKKKEKIALAEHLPSVALTANYLVTNPNSFNGFKNDFGGMFNVGVAVQVPISGWWEGTYKRNAARAETHIKQLELDDAKEKIELQVNQSVYKVNEAGKKLTASSRNKEKAEENLRHATIGFEEGVIPALNLMEAQTAWVEAQSDLIDAQIEVKLTDVYLSKALGRLSSTTNNK
ncbi:TolC family protein [Macellibacteroides fermentans]|jgi:outer membrane protein TolC|uniref:Outer membrane protein TolC n=1 Tax=Parabacteroides chartae TaxID=1037355 RepID=A0A1T4ZYR8_9BACT|nr:TolC family protein [Parabacteroides chartae]OCW93174.1 alkaline protease [Macellibacteroides sp. HH-ZS]SKB27870.1 Outer membrane protein TolC [Parabacteroides chartae]HNU38020.1 TolC family protein [Macellibacteroides fermentans]